MASVPKGKASRVLPELGDWPIIGITRNRQAFLKEVTGFAKERILRQTVLLEENIERALFLEEIRMRDQKWSTDPSDEGEFWKSVKSGLLDLAGKPKEEAAAFREKMLDDILARYAKEIAGRFSTRAYNWSQKILNILFYPLLNAPVYLNFLEKRYSRQVEKRIHLSGDIAVLKELANRHTIVLVPTHFSNLDSVTVGWAARAIGLPPLLYGAGLNLFGIGLFSFFMNRIGAFKIDRRKKNAIYLEVLKAYSSLALTKGCHEMFFPYADRSLSGSIDGKLKLGMLGAALEAQFLNIANSEGKEYKKIVIVPLVLNYHFVLEAPFLVDEFFRSTGKENYLNEENDQFSSSWGLLKVIYKLFTRDSDFTIRFGSAMDVFGNKVDENGKSFDERGREINLEDYFRSGQDLKEDSQRNAEYVRMLGGKIYQHYLRENTVFSSHLVAFVAFSMIQKRHPKKDLYDLLRLPSDERTISLGDFEKAVSNVFGKVSEMEKDRKLNMDPFLLRVLGGNVRTIIDHGIKNAGVYHAEKVLFLNEKNQVGTGDMKLLYYYHNRLKGYSLENFIP